MRVLLGSGGIRTEARMAAWTTAFDAFIGPIRRVLFVPFALGDHDGYVARLVERGFDVGRELVGLHRGEPDARRAVETAEAIFVGGGNSFRLLAELTQRGLLDAIRRRVMVDGVPYVGVSAGSNLAGPTIMTTNDMPITWLPSFDALGLVPFQINPHYFSGAMHYETDAGLVPYAGETRDDRLREFHELNATPVVAMWEGGILQIEQTTARLVGPEPAKLFRRHADPQILPPNSDVSFLLAE